VTENEGFWWQAMKYPQAAKDVGGGLSKRAHNCAKIIPGGNSGGRMPPAGDSGGQPLLETASVGPGQGLYGRYRDVLVVHGKEKVYGSIP
jgi:hypothetical protein